VAQLGNTWIPELAELHALEALAPRVQQSAAVQPSDYFDGIWSTNLIDGVLVWRALVRRYAAAVLSHGSAEEGRIRCAAGNWREWRRTLAALKEQAGAQRFSILLPLNEFRAADGAGPAAARTAAARGGGRGNFDSPGFRKALGFYVEMFDAAGRRWCPRLRSPTSGTSSGAAILPITSPVPGTSLSSGAPSARAQSRTG